MKAFFQKLVQIALLALFFINSVVPPDFARAQFAIPAPNLFVSLSPRYSPVIVRGLSIYPNDPFKFDFIIDTGDDNLSGAEFKSESEKLIKYFLAALTVPEKELWVNLSPYEKNRVIPEGLGKTQMGVDMLAQDYLLKRITASLTYPESNLGKKFWDRVYSKASQKFGTTDIPVNTFNKVWIAPDRAVVYEKNNHVFIAERHLRVMLEEDYLALSKHQGQPGDMALAVSRAPASVRQEDPSRLPTNKGLQLKAPQGNNQSTNTFSSQIVKEIVLPELEKEVNTGKNFATLRQMYNSLILASWYKKKIKDSILAYVYANKNKVKGINIDDPQEKEIIYQQYLKAFKKGVYNYIKEDMDPASGQTIPRKYFSGGITVGAAGVNELAILSDAAQLSSTQRDFILHPPSASGQDLMVTWQAVTNKIDSDAAMTVPLDATILDAKDLHQGPINPVSDSPARLFPDINIAERKPKEIPLFIDISDDLNTLTYYEVIDDSKVYAPDGSIHYEALSVGNGTLKEIKSFPSSNLVSPRKWMLEHFKGTLEGDLINKIWSQGKRYTRYHGVITSWNVDVDKDVWSFNIDTGYCLETFNKYVLPYIKHKVKKITEVGVGEGGISSALAKLFPDAQYSGTDISAYALSTYLLNMLANHPEGKEALKRIKTYWGRGIANLENNQDFIFENPPYIPVPPFEKADEKDPYRGTGLIRETVKDGYKKLNPDNPEASIFINISSLAEKDFQRYVQEFNENIEVIPVGPSREVPLKLNNRLMSEAWKEWLLNQNGGLRRNPLVGPDQEEYLHSLQLYRIRRKVEVPKPKRVVIIGGTFDPFHIAHKKMVQDVKRRLDADEVIVVPTNVSPHKQGIPSVSKEIRFEMAKSALAGLEGVKVSDYEINRDEVSYSINTVNHIIGQYPPDSKFYYVIGDDNAEKLDTWKDIDELKKKVEFVAYARPERGKTSSPSSVQRIEHPAIDISATMIRQRAAVGLPIDLFVTPEVERIIKEKNLYLPEEVFAANNHDPIKSLNVDQPFKDDKPFVLIVDAHGTLLISNWKKEYADAYQHLTGRSFDAGLQWVENNIVREIVSTTRDVPFGDIVDMFVRELAFSDIHKTRDEILQAIKNGRTRFWKPEESQARPGAVEALRQMKKMGIPIKVVTGSRDSNLIYRQLKHAGFGDLISEDDVYAKDKQEKIPVTDSIDGSLRERAIKYIMDGYQGKSLLLLDDWTQGAQVVQKLGGYFIALPQGEGKEQLRNSLELQREGAAMEITDARGYERFVSLIKVLNARRENRQLSMITKNVRVAMTSQPKNDQAMLTDMVPLTATGEKRIVEIKSDKGPIRMEISEFSDNEIHTILQNPQIIEGAHVTMAHSINTTEDILQAILIMDHLRQYQVGKIDLLVKGKKFMGVEDGLLNADSYLMTALSFFADSISYIDKDNYVHEVKNIQPLNPITKQELPLQVDRLLYINNQFQPEALEDLKILPDKAKAEYVTIKDGNGLRFVKLPPDLKGKNVVVYHSTESAKEIVDLILTLIGLRQAGVNSISLINSYLGYARQDKKKLPGEMIAAATILETINRLVDRHYVINAHFGRATGEVQLQGIRGTEFYNLNGFVPTAEFMFNSILNKIFKTSKTFDVAKVEELSWSVAKQLGPAIENEFKAHPVLIVGPDKGSKIYSQEAARELKRLVKAAYGVDITVYVGYIPKERNPETGEIKRSESPEVLDIDTDKPLNKLGDRSIKDAWAFVLDDMTDSGKTILSATYILVKNIGLQWNRVLTGIVHGVLSQGLVPFKTGLTDDQIRNATANTLPNQAFIDDKNGRMPPILLTAMQTLMLPDETASFKQVPINKLIGYVIQRIIGAGLREIADDNSIPFWQLPPQQYVDYLNRFVGNHGYPKRDLQNPPEYTSDEIKKRYPMGLKLGKPTNDLQTGMTGLGKLYHKDDNAAEDPVLLTVSPKGELFTIDIDRRDGTGRGFPGGFINFDQKTLIGNTATRECIEEALVDSKYAVDFRKGKVIYEGKAYSSRDTDNAWVTTRAVVVLIHWEKAQLLTVSAGDDAVEGSARLVKVDKELLSTWVDAHPYIMKKAVKAFLDGELKFEDERVKPLEALRREVTNEKDAAMTAAVTTPNTFSEDSKIRIDSSFLEVPLTPKKREELKQQLIRLNPGYDPAKLFHMTYWDPREFEYEHMPVVVGRLEDERAFSTPKGFRKLDEAKRMPDQGWALSKDDEQFKEVFQMAVEDQRLINPDFDKFYYAYFTVDQKIVPPHTSQRRPGWHGDAFISSETSELYDVDGQRNKIVTDNTYVVSDALPTLFYPGPFSLRGVDADDIRAVLKHFEDIGRDKMPFRYPAYTLLRMTPYDLHTPDFNNTDHPIVRTFVKIQFSRDRLNRGGNAINPLLNYDGWYWVPRGTERNNRNTLIGNRRPDRDKFLLVDPNSIDFEKDTVDVPWLKKDFFWGIRVKGVKAEHAKAGEVLVTTNEDFEITENTAQEGDWKITTVLGGQYFLSDKDFRQLYRVEPDAEGWHPPINRHPVKMVEITQAVRLKARWGKMEFLPAGSILVKRAQGDVYGIHREDFIASYVRTDPQDNTRLSSIIKTKGQFDRVISTKARASKYALEFSKDGKNWNLDLQLPPKLDLNEQVKEVTFVLDVDETLASQGLQEGITPKNLEQILRAFRLMKQRPDLKIRFIINSANTYLQYVPSRFGKTLPQLAVDKYFQSIDNHQKISEEIFADLKAQGIEDPNKIPLLVARRLSIKERIMKPLIQRLREEGLEDYFQYIELRTATGQETIKYDPLKKEFVYNQNPKLMFEETEQLDIAKILLTAYLKKLGEKLGIDFSTDIKNINDAHKYLNTDTSIGAAAIFENALAKADINARIAALNGEIGVLYYNDRARVDGNALSLSVLSQLQQHGLVKPWRKFFVSGNRNKGVRVSLFDKSIEIKSMIGPNVPVVEGGDTDIDTFLTDTPNDMTIPMFLGEAKDMRDNPGVIVAKDINGKDNLREKGTHVLMGTVLDAMEKSKTWGDVKFVNNLFSPNEIRDALPDEALTANDLGGINFDPSLMDLQVKRDEHGVPLPLYQQPVSIININGVTPVIINIQPFKDISAVLGLNQVSSNKSF